MHKFGSGESMTYLIETKQEGGWVRQIFGKWHQYQIIVLVNGMEVVRVVSLPFPPL